MKNLILIILNLSFVAAFGQTDSSNLEVYSYAYKFKEGLYLDFFDLKNNNPIPFESFVSPKFENEDFFDQFEKASTISFYDSFGILTELPIEKIWGYCRRGKPYIYWADKFNLIPYFGNVSHFITTVIVKYSSFQDPFYDPYGYNSRNRNYESEELRQFLIDSETGAILDYTSINVEAILTREPSLHEEFSKLGKRKKNKQMFYFIRLYNEQNPLYLPKQ